MRSTKHASNNSFQARPSVRLRLSPVGLNSNVRSGRDGAVVNSLGKGQYRTLNQEKAASKHGSSEIQNWFLFVYPLALRATQNEFLRSTECQRESLHF